MKRLAALLAALFCVSALALPCLWDMDTLRYEASGLPGVVEVITGRFEREPARYYEVRLERVTRELAADPTKLELYDDAGVACDRLHRGDEAIAWMERKFAQLDAAPDSPAKSEALYRYHANLGTFLAHRWLRTGADRTSLGDLRSGREHIQRAIEINPDAHFGRERYQLFALDWLIELPAPSKPGFEFDQEPWTLLDACPPELRLPPRKIYLDSLNAADPNAAAATKALTGLIVMGDAWQSVDVFNALARSLESQGHSSLAYLAALRAQELARAGRRSLHPELAAADPEFAARVASFAAYFIDSEPLREVEEFFASARDEADDWHALRTAFMLRQIEAGRHPDTDSEFWNSYTSATAPVPPGRLISGREAVDRSFFAMLGVAGIFALVVVVGGVALVRRAWRRRRVSRAP
jgi:tetratricopeptide (TPR) repeat protein